MNTPIWDTEEWTAIGSGTGDPLSGYRVLAWVSGAGHSAMGLGNGDYQQPEWIKRRIGSGFGWKNGNGMSLPER